MAARADVQIGASLDGSFGSTIANADKQIGGIGKSWSQWSSGTQAGLANQQRAIQNSRSELRGQLLDVAAVGTAMYGLMQPAIEFEDQLASVRKVLPKGADFDGIRDGIQQLALEIPIAREEIVDLAAAGARMGIDGKEDLLAYTEMVGKMAIAWEMSGAEAGDSIAKIGNIMGLTIEQQQNFGDALNTLDDTTVAKANELVDVLLRTGAAGKDLGLTAEQMAAIAATSLSLGQTAETAGTSILNMFQVLRNAPNLKGVDSQQGFGTMGLDPDAFQARMFADPIAAIKEFGAALKELDAPAQSKAIADIFGVGVVDESTRKLLVNLDQLDTNLATVADTSLYLGSVQREFEIRSETLANKLKLMGSQAEFAATSIGNALTPAVAGIADAFGPALVSVGQWAAANSEIVSTVGAVIGGLAGIKGLAVVGGYAFTFIAEGATILASGLTALVSPIGLAVAALAAGGFLIWKYWEPISTFFSSVWAGLAPTFGEIGAAVMSAVQPFVDMGTAIADWLMQFEPVRAAVEATTGWFSSLFEQVGLGTDDFNAITAAGVTFGKWLGDGLKLAVDLALGPIEMIGAAIKLLSGDFEGAKLGAENALSGVLTVATGFYKVGEAIVQAIWDGLQAMWGSVTSWFSGAVDDLIGMIPDWLRQQMGIGDAIGVVRTKDALGNTVKALDHARLEEEAKRLATAEANSKVNVGGFLGMGEDQAKVAERDAMVGTLYSKLLSDLTAKAQADIGAGTPSDMTADTYKEGAQVINGAMSQAVALESARAAALAAEKPRSIEVNTQAPITINNYGGGDVTGQVQKAISGSATDVLQAEQDGFVD